MAKSSIHLVRFAITLAITYVLLTALLWNAPGRDIDESRWGASTSEVRAEYQRPWSTYVEFSTWYANELAHGRGGNSTLYGVPVTELIAERASVTFGHAWRGFAAAWLAALLGGVTSHFWPAAGRLGLGLGSLILSLPVAFVVLSLVLGGAAPWIGLAVCVWPKTYSYWETLLDLARKRNHVLAMLGQGAGPWRVQWYAVWMPQMRQLAGLVAVSIPLLLGTLIPVEVLCDEPGLGQLAWRAVGGRDLPLLTTLTLGFTAIACAMSLLSECILPERT